MSDGTDMVVQQEDAEDERPCVVILGGGFGGINAARKLKGADCRVVVVDKQNHHLFQPLLYQVATAGLSPGDIASPIRAILRKQSNASVLLGEALEVDRESQTVQLATGVLSYDYLIVATGTQPQYFGPEEYERNSTPLKTVEDALELRRQILSAFEHAEQLSDPDAVREWLTFVIVGGGPTGVEMAGAIREIAAEVMVRDFRTIKPEEARVVLVDALPHILSSYPESLSENAREELEERGVEVWTEAPIESITERTVTAGGETVPTRTVIWAAGVEPVPLVGTLDTAIDDTGRVVVDEDLTLTDDDRVFAIGDIAHFDHGLDEPLPGLAPVAIQQGKAAARNIERRIDGEAYEAFEYWDRGQMSTIGRNAAVAVVGDLELKGFIAWLAWLFIHLLFLIGFRNKVAVLFDWAYSYVAFKRGARLIVGAPKQQQIDSEIESHRLLESDESDSVEEVAEASEVEAE